PRPVAVGHDDDATILYTSGSTGTAKGAVSTHRAILSGLKSWAAYFGALRGLTEAAMTAAGRPLPSDPVASLQTVPLFHVTGCNALFLMCFPIGRKLVLMRKWEVAAARRLIAAERITHFVGVPTQSHELLTAPGLADHDLSSLVDIGGGGAARPASHVGDLLGAFPNAAPALGYGLTETNALGCVTNGPDYAARPASTGRPTPPTSEISIRDDAFRPLPAGEVGEICLRNPANMRGYWNRPDATRAALVDGWFRSGDLGYLDADGFLFIVDRAKDIIVRGGENIAAQEVENCLYRHPGVAEATVFGLPDTRLGEIVAAVVHLAAGARLDADSLRAHADAHLARFKIPARIWFSTAPLPRTASEKIDKRAVRALYSDNQENTDKEGEDEPNNG
ncbi:MAG: class I adenylate-forming enzyme family protein, partial [Thalassobaculaceae bacterium]